MGESNKLTLILWEKPLVGNFIHFILAGKIFWLFALKKVLKPYFQAHTTYRFFFVVHLDSNEFTACIY